MRWCVSIGMVLVAGALTGGDVAGIAAPNPSSQLSNHLGPQLADKETVPSVDVELVLAVDVSYSSCSLQFNSNHFAPTSLSLVFGPFLPDCIVPVTGAAWTKPREIVQSRTFCFPSIDSSTPVA